MNGLKLGKAMVLASALVASGMVFADPGYKGHGDEGGMHMGGWGGGSGMMGGGHGMMGGGMGMMGPGMGMMGGFGPIWALNLNEDQRKKVRDIHTALRKKHAALRTQMEDDSDKLWELYSQEQRDPAAIGKVYSKIFDVQRQMIEEQITAHNKVEELLTKEQRAQMRQMSHQWRWNNNQ